MEDKLKPVGLHFLSMSKTLAINIFYMAECIAIKFTVLVAACLFNHALLHLYGSADGGGSPVHSKEQFLVLYVTCL